MTSLEVKFAGVKMRTPVGVAALSINAPASLDGARVAELLMRNVDAGAGYVHIPNIRLQETHPKDWLPTSRCLGIGSARHGFQGFFWACDEERVGHRLDSSLKVMDILKKKLPEDVPIIANISGPGADPERWAKLALKMEGVGANLIELDIGCPMTVTEKESRVEEYETKRIPGDIFAGVLVGDSPELAVPITKEVAKKVKIPVGIKFSPEVGFPRLISFVKQLREAGARFITSVNCGLSVAPPDIYNGGKSLYPMLEANPITGASGPWLKWVCYRNVGTISKFVPEVDQAAVGGLVEHKNIVEAIMLGAKIVELSSGILLKGWNFVRTSNTFLTKYMEEQGYKTIEDFCGLAVQYIKPSRDVDWGLGRVVAKVDASKCDGCGICADNLCYAMHMKNGKAEVNFQDCSACGLCVAICPKKAVTLGEK